MLRRLLTSNAQRRAWSREHNLTWAGMMEPTESGLNRFQVMCESALVAALRNSGGSLADREVLGVKERHGKARVVGTPWTLWIYPNGAELSSDGAALVRLEEWDARTPDDFVASFVSRVLEGMRKQGDGPV